MAANDQSWFPPRGRYHVEVATSVTKALKARKVKGEGPPPPSKPSKIPSRDFHSFRYNFHPPSLNRDGVGSITVRTGKDATSVSVERSSSQPGEGSLFNGSEHPAKEWECILIFDEVNKKFVLEKLDSHMALTFERKVTMPLDRAPPRAAPPAESSRNRAHDLSQEAEELEKQYLGADEDAIGEVDDELEENLPPSIAQRQEEEEEEEIHIPPPPPPSLPKSNPKPTRTAKPSAPPPAPTPTPPIPAQKPRQAPKPAALPPKPKTALQQRGKKNKREPEPSAPASQHLSDADEELEFGKPAKRARPSPPSEGLALPGISTPVFAPPPPPTFQPSAPRRASPPPPPPPPPPAPVYESEEEEEWDEVAAVDKTKSDNVEEYFDIFGEAAAAGSASGGPQDIEMDAFERELNLQMEASDEDFLADAVEPESDGEEPVRVPISLTQLAAGANGGVGYASEDEYSSSDDSDDD